MTDGHDLDEIRRELASLAERLIDVPESAIAERTEIIERQRELRAIVRERVTAGDLLSADQLERSIEVLRRQIADHYGNRLSHSSGPQTGLGGGLDPKQLHEMNRKMDALADIDGMKKRLRTLEDRLAAMRRSS